MHAKNNLAYFYLNISSTASHSKIKVASRRAQVMRIVLMNKLFYKVQHTHFLTTCTTSSSVNRCSLPTFCGWCFTDAPHTRALQAQAKHASLFVFHVPATSEVLLGWHRLVTVHVCFLFRVLEFCLFVALRPSNI